MIELAVVILLVVVYEVGYCQGRKSHEKSLKSKVNLVRGIYAKNTKDDSSKSNN